jgi:hypothetical protein
MGTPECEYSIRETLRNAQLYGSDLRVYDNPPAPLT